MKNLLLIAAIALPTVGVAKREQPNIVLINVDDMGWADMGCYGAQEYPTPNLDSMARRGVRLTDFYSAAPVSTPSRAALLTGKYPIQSNMHAGVIHPFTNKGLSPDHLTIAEHLRESGYATACIGKWHLGHSKSEFMPNNHGFDYFFGIPYSNDMDARTYKHFQADPLPIYENDKVVDEGMDQRFLQYF